ncbi:MAG: hypothetical protein JWM77_1566 [Rhodospirillales bacterium]|nr:hypothetical protein [Rhodospirillales bacterium]
MFSDLNLTDPHSAHGLSGFLRTLDPVNDFALVWTAGALLGALVGLGLWLLAA